MLYTVERFTCHKCKNVIYPDNGIILKGDIFRIQNDVKKRDYLLSSDYNTTETKREIAICNDCLIEILKVFSYEPPEIE